MTRSTPATPLARRRTVLGAALLASAALSVGMLSACGAGQVTGTDTQVAAVPGVSKNSADGKIAIRDASIAYADEYKAGSTVPLSVRIFNNNPEQSVKLTGVTVGGGGTVVLVGGAAAAAAPAPTTASPSPSSASPSASGSRRPSGSPSNSPAETATATMAVAPSPTPAGSSQISVGIPVAGFVALSPETKTYLAIDKLSGEALRAGANLADVTFTFTYADGTTTTVTFDELPMTTPLTPLPKPSAVVGGGEEGH